jgi:glycosyltransferase involved in cell wall biosynthesis
VVGSTILIPWYRFPPFNQSGIGGLSVVVWETARALSALGLDIEVLVPEGAATSDPQSGTITVTANGLGTRIMNQTKLDEKEIARLRDYDAILSVANFGAESISSSRQLKPLVTRQLHMVAHDRSISTYLPLKPSLIDYGKMWVQKMREEKYESILKGTRSICVSEFIAERAVQAGIEDARNVRVVPNGVETESFKPLLVEKKFDLLCMGRFQIVKGTDILFKALKVLGRTVGRRFHVGIIGNFSHAQRAYLLSLTTPGMGDSVTFLGTVSRPDMPVVINSTRFLVIPSRYESFGLPALEGLACGVPVIATKTGGLPEIVDPSVGRLVSETSPSALAESIESAFSSDSLEERCRKSGPLKAQSYDWNLIARRIADIITSREAASA